ncbi:hypothetical protein NQ317_006311 [Molorchus minor]|uniref:Uncharacterized protein n=1 Tax=Molorchus minor TaxID=1323400 RepID=A0ABQ9JCN0_9CUCU|nr:hypothetical protein NQ317_006311 [Molorchus minor]
MDFLICKHKVSEFYKPMSILVRLASHMINLLLYQHIICQGVSMLTKLSSLESITYPKIVFKFGQVTVLYCGVHEFSKYLTLILIVDVHYKLKFQIFKRSKHRKSKLITDDFNRPKRPERKVGNNVANCRQRCFVVIAPHQCSSTKKTRDVQKKGQEDTKTSTDNSARTSYLWLRIRRLQIEASGNSFVW